MQIEIPNEPETTEVGRPEQAWRLEEVLMLGAGLVLSLALGMVTTQVMEHYATHLNIAQRKFGSFVISNIFFQGAVLVLTHFFLRRHQTAWVDFLGLRKPGLGRAVLFGMVTAIVVVPGTQWLIAISKALLGLLQEAPEIQQTIQVLHVSISLWQRIIFGFAAIVLAPVAEEILFRGILYAYLKQLGYQRLAVIGSSLFFAVIHGNLMALVPLAFFAVVLALLYDKTGNLMAPIATHAVFNAVNFVFYLREGP